MKDMSKMCMIAQILMIIGALNWGLVGALDMNLVAMVFGASMVAKVIYIVVGLAGIYSIWGMIKK